MFQEDVLGLTSPWRVVCSCFTKSSFCDIASLHISESTVDFEIISECRSIEGEIYQELGRVVEIRMTWNTGA